jgi:ATP-binding cassette subfamily F protein 3
VFPGSFVEWEQVRAERLLREAQQTRADQVRASERAATQRERARDQQAREKSASGEPKKLLRAAEKALADAELRVATLEKTIASLESQLDDASLYDTPAGVQKAVQLGKQLDEAREAMEDAMHEWSTADEYVGLLKAR